MGKTAYIRPGSIGDVVMSLNYAKEIVKKEGEIFCSDAIHSMLEEFFCGYACLNLRKLSEYKSSNYQKTVNLIGYPIDENYPHKPMKKHLLEYFAKEFQVETNYDGLKSSMPPLPNQLRRETRPQHVTIQVKTGWSVYKEWWGWENLVEMIKSQINDLKICQIGGPDDPIIENVDYNLCGQSFTTNLSAQAWAVLHIGLDSVFNHTTNIQWIGKGRTPAVILFGSTQASASGYSNNENISLNLECQPCFRENPKISRQPLGLCVNPPQQTYEKPRHACMANIYPEMVLGKAMAKLKRSQAFKNYLGDKDARN